MKCIIPSQNVKIVARAIHSLAKIGDDLFIVPSVNDLIFYTVNSAQSALCELRMCKSFFSSYNFTVDDQDVNCQISLKSCLGVFKNPHCADKQVESCEIRFKSEGTVVIFYIKYAKSYTKKFFLPIINSDKVEIQYAKDAPNKITASSKLLASSFKNFRINEDEITVRLSGDKVVVKNHLEPGRDKGLMRTELSFQPSDFECCTITSPSAITFTLKEMRSAINFAEPANLPINIHITGPGEPIILKVAFQPAYEATYVISTLRASRMELESSNSVTQVSSVPSRQTARLPQPSVNKSNNVIISRPGPSTRSENLVPEAPLVNNSIPCGLDALPVQHLEPDENFSKSVQNISLKDVQAPSTSLKNFSPTSFASCNPEEPMDVDSHIPKKNVELITTVFQRCFAHKLLFDSLAGTDVILCQASDSE